MLITKTQWLLVGLDLDPTGDISCLDAHLSRVFAVFTLLQLVDRNDAEAAHERALFAEMIHEYKLLHKITILLQPSVQLIVEKGRPACNH